MAAGIAVIVCVFWTLVQGDFVEIGNLPANVSIHEDTVLSTFLYSVTAYSPDGLPDCEIVSGNAVPAVFTIARDALHTFYTVNSVATVTPGLDYGIAQNYSLVINCSQGAAFDTQTLTVDVIENTPPDFSNLPGSVIISAKTVKLGHVIFAVSYTDPDDSPPLTYTNVDNAGGPFTIADDVVTATADLLNHTGAASYVLKFDVADTRTNITEQNITITINDINNKPTIDNLDEVINLVEGTSGRTLVYDIAHSDADGDTVVFEYAIVDANNSIFDLVGTTGEIYLQDGQTLDFETRDQYVFNVTVRDHIHSMTDPYKVLTLDVIDVNEAPYYNVTPSAVTLEESSNGTIIPLQNVSCVDPDNFGASSPDTLSYSILTDTYTSYFAIDSSTAEVTLDRDWDYDDKTLPTSVTLTIRCSDPDLVSADADYVISFTDINDNDPVCVPSQTMLNLTYQQNTTETLLNTQCSDKDETVNAALTYAITGLSEGYGVTNFVIDSNGNVSLKTNFTMTFDTSFYITIVVADQGSTPISTTVTLTVYYTAAPVAPFVWEEIDTCFLCTTATITMISAAAFVLLLFVIFCGVLGILKLCHDHEKKKIIKALSKGKKKTKYAFKRHANEIDDENYEDYHRDTTNIDGETRLRSTTKFIHRNGHVANTDDEAMPGAIPGRTGLRALKPLSRDQF